MITLTVDALTDLLHVICVEADNFARDGVSGVGLPQVLLQFSPVDPRLHSFTVTFDGSTSPPAHAAPQFYSQVPVSQTALMSTVGRLPCPSVIA